MSAQYGPFQTRVGLYQRFPNFIDLLVRNTPDAKAYRLWAAPSLNDAYGDPTGSGVGGSGPSEILEVALNGLAQTAGAAKAGCSKIPENRKGQTSFQADPRDIPASDEDFMYFRVQERRKATGDWLIVTVGPDAGDPIMGPILMVPSVAYNYQPAVTYTMWGKAPSNTGCAEGHAPAFDVTAQVPNPMHIVFPRPVSGVTVKNTDDAASLLFSYGVGQPMIRLPKGEAWTTSTGHGPSATTEMLFADDSEPSVGGGSGCAFSLYLLTDHGGL